MDAANAANALNVLDQPRRSTGSPPAGDYGRLQVGLLLLPALLRRGLAAALTEAGHRVDVVPDLPSLPGWVREATGRPVVVTSDEDQALRALDRLRTAAPEVRSVVLLTAAAVSGYNRVLPHCTCAVPHDSDVVDALTAVQAASSGFTLLPAPLAQELVARGTDLGSPPQLDAQQRTWLRRLAEGDTVSRIARSAHCSDREMYRLLSEVYLRLGARTRTEALLRADRCGLLVDRPDPRDARAGHVPSAAVESVAVPSAAVPTAAVPADRVPAPRASALPSPADRPSRTSD